jgi:hypothetical protein
MMRRRGTESRSAPPSATSWVALVLLSAAASGLFGCGGRTVSDGSDDSGTSLGGADTLGGSGGTGAAGVGGATSTGGSPSGPSAICPGEVVSEIPSMNDYCAGWEVEDSPAPCELETPRPPSGETLNVDWIAVWFVLGGAQWERIPYIESVDACATSPYGGWYMDAEQDPLTLRVCPCTCARFRRDSAGELKVWISCDTGPPIE